MTTETKKKIAVVFYHAECMDGIGALWAYLHLHPKDSIAYYPFVYNKTEIPKYYAVKQEEYYHEFVFLDCCPSIEMAETILAITEGAKDSITIIDHHETAKSIIKQLESYVESGKIKVNLSEDNTMSGATLTWTYYAEEGRAIPRTLEYIEDYDLYRNKLRNSMHFKEFFYSVVGVENRLELLTDCFSSVANLNEILLRGAAIHDLKRREADEIIASCATHHPTIWGDIVFCNTPIAIRNEVADTILKDKQVLMVATYRVEKDQVKYSLRSRKEDSFSIVPLVEAIARKCYAVTGGGHKSAVGMTSSFQVLDVMPYIMKNTVTKMLAEVPVFIERKEK